MPSTPFCGGAIQEAIFPGSSSGFIKLFTKARSSAVGSHSARRFSNASSLIGAPSRSKKCPAYIPMERLKRRFGSFTSKVTPSAAIERFHFFTARSQSATYSSRRTSFSALRRAISFVFTAPPSSTFIA